MKGGNQTLPDKEYEYQEDADEKRRLVFVEDFRRRSIWQRRLAAVLGIYETCKEI